MFKGAALGNGLPVKARALMGGSFRLSIWVVFCTTTRRSGVIEIFE